MTRKGMRTRSGALLAVALVCVLTVTSCGSTSQPSAADDDRRDRADPAQPSAAAGTARVVAAGDIACKPRSRVRPWKCRHRATAKVAARMRPHVVLPLGDLQYERGTLRQFRRSYARSWGKLASRTRPTIGNHEYGTPGARGYFSYFWSRQPGPPGYYRTTTGSWALYHLNSNCSMVNCASQAAWLDQQMTARPARCTLVTMHHPRFSSGSHGNQTFVEPLWDVAYEHRNDLVLSGHEHLYERFLPMDGAGRIEPSRGMQSFIVGTGGKDLFPYGTRKAGSAYLQNRLFGVLVLVLHDGWYSWGFKAVTGQILDRGARSCV